MLKTVRRLLIGKRSPHAADRRARVESLEKRSLLSAAGLLEAPPMNAAVDPDVTGPMLVKEQLIGPDPRNVEGVVLTFNEPLDPATAQDVKNFRVGARTDRRQRFEIDTSDRQSRRGLVRFESAVYDPATFTVTLTARDPFNITRRFRAIRVLGRDGQGVRDVAGNLLDGNADGQPGRDSIQQFTFKRAARVTYGERDGDNVALSLNGGGRLWVIRKTNGGKVLARGDALRVYIDKADPTSSILTGKVTGKGDGVAVINELVNTTAAQVQIAGDPAFQIIRAIP